MSKKVMKLLDPSTGLMECKVCGHVHLANTKSGGGYYRGAWQCVHGCRLGSAQPKSSADDEPKPPAPA